MEINDGQVSCDIDSLKDEISQNEKLISDYLQTASNMKWMAIGSTLLAIVFFSIGSLVSGFGVLVLAFFCLRKYNRSMGMAEVYFGVTKFLKLMLQRELSGESGLPGFLAE